MTDNSLEAAIVPLKQIARKHHLSAQRIYDMIEQAGDHVSLNTIKKFLADGSESQGFNYYQSIAPIGRALRSLEPAAEESEDMFSIMENYIRFLQEQIRIKDAQLNAVLRIVG